MYNGYDLFVLIEYKIKYGYIKGRYFFFFKNEWFDGNYRERNIIKLFLYVFWLECLDKVNIIFFFDFVVYVVEFVGKICNRIGCYEIEDNKKVYFKMFLLYEKVFDLG